MSTMITEHDTRFNKIEADLLVLKWMAGFNLAATMAVITLLLRR